MRENAPDIESSSDAYALRFRGPAGAWFLDRQAGAVLRLLRSLRGTSVLEVGGGHAQLAGRLHDAGFHVTVQGSAPVCAARIRRLKADPPVPFVVGKLDRLPFPDRSFDVVLSVRTLAHVDDPDRFLLECARVAARGVLVDFASRRSLNALSGLLFRVKRRVERDTRPFRLLPPGEPARTLRGTGLAPAGSVPQFFWPMVLHRLHARRWLGRLLEAPPAAVGLTRLLGSPVIALYLRGRPDARTA